MYLKRILPVLLLLITAVAHCQDKQLIPLWPGKVPGQSEAKANDIIDTAGKDNVLRITKVTDPAIEVWLPGKKENTGVAIIVCPGGGYVRLAYNKEGTEIAQWLNKNGIAAFVLKYRVPDNRVGALQDAQRAIRIIRQNAKKWNIDPDKTGIMGFSAGGSLSARSATLFDERIYGAVDQADSLSCRPSFALLIYPAYLDQGENRSLTPELNVRAGVPPVFIFQAADDTYANSSLVMAQALRDHKIPVELHLVPKGGHGFGLRTGNPAAVTWPPLAEKWLEETAGVSLK